MSFEQWQQENSVTVESQSSGGFEAWQSENVAAGSPAPVAPVQPAPVAPVQPGEPQRIPLKQDVMRAIKETPEDIKIGTIQLGANVLSAVKRRAVQLSGGGILPDEMVLAQYEPVEARPITQRGLLGQTPEERRLRDVRLPGAIAAQAAGVVTRLPDIGSRLLNKEAERRQAEQDEVTLATSPLTRLHRSVVQSGVPSVGAAVGISLLTGDPLIGLALLGETEGGAAFQEQLESGASVRKATVIGDLSEAAEIGGEMLVFPRLLKGFKGGLSIREGLTLIAENATQEGITAFNQRFLESFGKLTTEGMDAKEAARRAFKDGVKAMPEGAFVGGAIGAGSTTVNTVADAILGEEVTETGEEAIEPEITPTVGETDVETPFEREDNGRQRDEERREELRPRPGQVEDELRKRTAEAEETVEAGQRVVLEEDRVNAGLTETEKPGAEVSPAKVSVKKQKALGTAQKLADQTGKTVYVKGEKVLIKRPPGKFTAVQPKVVEKVAEVVAKPVEAAKPEIITDAAEVQKIKNSIDEGELILRTGKFNGKQKSPEQLKAILKQVNKSRAKIGLGPTEVEVFKAKPKPTPVQAAKKTVEKETPGTLVSEKVEKEVESVIERDFTKDPTETSARQADIAEDRKALGLDQINSEKRRGWEKAMKVAKKEGIARKADRIAEQILESPVEDMGDVQTAGLVTRMAELKKEHKQVNEAFNKETDVAMRQIRAAEIQQIEKELDKLQKAVHLSGSEAGRTLAAQKLTLDENFDLASVVNRASVAKQGKELSKRQRVNFEKLTKDLEAATTKIEQLAMEMQEMKARKFVKKGRTATQFRTMNKAQKDSELADLVAKTNRLIKEGCAK